MILDDLCPICRRNKALKDPYWGIMPCDECQNKTKDKPSKQSEMVGEDIKEQRRAHGKDILPPHRKGQLDKGWVERYGKKKAKERGFTDKEIKESKYVWAGSDENNYYGDGN